MKIKVSEATGIVLDWMVAKCEGVEICEPVAGLDHRVEVKDPYTGTYSYDYYTPSKNWAQGGPLIEREYISLWTEGYNWEAKKFGEYEQYGDSVLEAAMRCYVASKLGYEVEVPDEIV